MNGDPSLLLSEVHRGCVPLLGGLLGLAAPVTGHDRRHTSLVLVLPVPPLGVDRPVGLVRCLRMLACPRPPSAPTLLLLLPLGVQAPPFAAGIGWFVDCWPLAMRTASAVEPLEVRCLTVAGSPAAWGCRPCSW